MEENAESKELQIRKLEATVKSLSEELIKVSENRQKQSILVYWSSSYTQLTVCKVHLVKVFIVKSQLSCNKLGGQYVIVTIPHVPNKLATRFATTLHVEFGPISYLAHFIFIYIQANGIIKKLQGEVRGLVGKIKVKNTVTVSQEKVLQDVSDKLQDVSKDLQSTHQQLITKNEQVCLRSCVFKVSFLKSPVCSD